MNETVNEKPLARFNHELLSLNRFWSMTESGDIAWLMDNGTLWFKPFSVQTVTSEINKGKNNYYTFRILLDKGDTMVTLILSYNTKNRAMIARDQMISLVNQREILFGIRQQTVVTPPTPSFFNKLKMFFKRK